LRVIKQRDDARHGGAIHDKELLGDDELEVERLRGDVGDPATERVVPAAIQGAETLEVGEHSSVLVGRA